MEVTVRVIAALKKDARERTIEDFNATFEYFVQVSSSIKYEELCSIITKRW